MSKSIVLCCFFLLFCSFAILNAQDNLSSENLSEMNLEELLNIEVTTASKKAENITDAPGIITTISAEEIKYLGANSLTDVLQRAPSIQPLISHLFGQNSISLRGDLRSLYDNHVLLLFNGRPVREGVTGGVNMHFYSTFPVEMIDKIEIIRGPGSVLYGSNAFAGVINIITKKVENGSSLNVNAGGGSFGTYNGSVSGNYSAGDFKSSVGFKMNQIGGWNYEASTLKPASPVMPLNFTNGQQNVGIVTDLSYKNLSFTGFYSRADEDVLGILPYTTYKGKDKFRRTYLNLGYNSQLNQKIELSMNLSYNRNIVTLNDESLIPADHHNSADFLGEVTLNSRVTENLNLILGGVIDSRNKYDVGTADPIKGYNQLLYSAYLQSDYKPVEKLKLILGAQLNKAESHNWDIVPRVGAIFDFTDNMGIKALYGEAFRSPWPVEQLLNNPAVRGNNNLDPEKIATIDIQIFYTKKSVEASLTFFNSRYSQVIERVSFQNIPGVITYNNLGKLEIRGLEFEGKTSVFSNIFITGSATYQKNLQKNKVNYPPEFMAKAGTFINLHKNLTVGVFNTFYGTPKENSGAKLNPQAKAVNLVSINICYKLPIPIPLEFTIYGQNLLDADYYYPEFSRGWVNTLPIGPGRSGYGKIAMQL